MKAYLILASVSWFPVFPANILVSRDGSSESQGIVFAPVSATDGTAPEVGAPDTRNCTLATEREICNLPVFVPGQSVCARRPATFAPNRPPPSRADRNEAERWLEYYPLCESYLNQKIAELQDEIVKAANSPPSAPTSMEPQVPDGGTTQQPATPKDGRTRESAPAAPTRGQVAVCNLQKHKNELVKAQIDQHTAYDVIRDELHEELDYATWLQQIVVAGTAMGGAGDTRDLGIDLRWDSRTSYPAGFRYSLSIGAHSQQNLLWIIAPATFSDLALGRDPQSRWAVPILGTLSWSWIQSSIFVSGGGHWVPDGNHIAAVGQIGIGFLQNWLRNKHGNGAGPVTEARFIVEPWIPLDHSGPVSVLFGLELGIGIGFGHSGCNPEWPSAKDCHPLNENMP